MNHLFSSSYTFFTHSHHKHKYLYFNYLQKPNKDQLEELCPILHTFERNSLPAPSQSANQVHIFLSANHSAARLA